MPHSSRARLQKQKRWSFLLLIQPSVEFRICLHSGFKREKISDDSSGWTSSPRDTDTENQSQRQAFWRERLFAIHSLCYKLFLDSLAGLFAGP